MSQKISKINVLSDLVVDQIAAGEIIERPANVVKELVENSLDGGATRVVVEIHGGGRKLIQITDDGIGMNEKELFLCVERFATSKIIESDDLNKVATFGFRGEALPSIASVSQMTILTTPQGSSRAFSIQVFGGKKEEIQEAVFERGTKISVRNLFFNVPPRLKFLKTDATEMRKIQQFIQAFSLAFPDCSFVLKNESKTLFEVFPKKSGRERMIEVFGKEFMDKSCPINYSFSQGKIFGFMSEPAFTRKDRNGIKAFINGRLVVNKALNVAINQFYRDKIPKGEFPSVILFLNLDPIQVDVNVHPAKNEVRFREESQVIGAIIRAFKEAFSKASQEKLTPSNLWESSSLGESKYLMPSPIEGTVDEKVKPPSSPVPVSLSDLKGDLFQGSGPKKELLSDSAIPSLLREEEKPVLSSSHPLPSSSVKLIGQVKKRYLIVEFENSMGIIDQHAAHERVLYERICRERSQEAVEIQDLLVPETMKMSPFDYLFFEDHIESLQKLGFGIDLFGKNTLKIDSVPLLFPSKNLKAYLENIVSDLKGRGTKKPDFDHIARSACRQAVMFGDEMSGMEQKKLIDDLFQCESPFTCPHGRPIIFHLTWSELDRKLGRT